MPEPNYYPVKSGPFEVGDKGLRFILSLDKEDLQEPGRGVIACDEDLSNRDYG